MRRHAYIEHDCTSCALFFRHVHHRQYSRLVPRYAEFLRGIRWLRQTGTLPSNFQTWQVQRLKVFAQELVQRGMKKRILLIRVANRSLRLRFHLTEVAMRCELRRKIFSAIDDLQHEPLLV